MRLKQVLVFGWRDYLAHPCALVGCQCIVHKLGLPQADMAAEIMHTPQAGRQPVWEKAQVNWGVELRQDKSTTAREPISDLLESSSWLKQKANHDPQSAGQGGEAKRRVQREVSATDMSACDSCGDPDESEKSH